MTVKREDGSWNISNIAALIICLPVVGWFLLISVTLYQLPDKVDKLADKVEKLTEQTNRNTYDLHTIKQVLHLDGGFSLSTNRFNVVNQSTTRDN